MAKWDVGDVVECVGVMHLVLAIDDETKQVRVAKLDGSDVHWRHEVNCRPVSFPIPAEKDPWKTSEPNGAKGEWCYSSTPIDPYSKRICTRPKGHSGHHLSRQPDWEGMANVGVVFARWKNDSAEAPKPECKVVDPGTGQACTEPAGHTGFCRSRDRNGRLLVSWNGPHTKYAEAQRTASDSPQAGATEPDWKAQQPSSPCARDAACGECAKLQLALENLKRSTQSEHADLRSQCERQAWVLGEVTVERDFLKRELERLRKRKP